MKIRSSGSNVQDVDMTPMIDVVFQLIAFFMVITNFEQNQADERVHLPKDQLARPPEVKLENSFTLNLGFVRDKDTGAVTNPKPRLFFGADEVFVEDSMARLRQEAQFYEALDVDLAEVTVEIRSDGDVSAGLVQSLIRKCQEVRASPQSTEGFQRFALRAKKSE
ncbi:MAG: biopolymer transporter ExbD [Planctomycetaceae bacterium]|jgi:biopolymer transport protein ExbD